MPKVTIVGAGNVGGAAAERLARSSCVDDLVLVDAVPGLAEGVALDIAHCGPLDGFETKITGSAGYEATEHSDVVVVTAGRARQPGQDRLDLLEMNAEIMASVVAQIAGRSPYAVLIVVTNPLDEMTYLASRLSGYANNRVLGMAGVLDSSRYRTFLSWELGVGPADVDAVTLGSHGDTMVPIVSHGQVHGRPLVDLLPGSVLQRVAQRTRDAGAEIVSLLGRGSAFHGPGAAIASMVEAIVDDRHETLPVCAWLSGEYGIRDVFLGVPAVLSRRGVERVVELPLDADELAGLRDAATKVAARCADLDRVLARTR